jgi:hypothetical protein
LDSKGENIMPLAYIVWVDQTGHPEHPIAPGGPPPVVGWTPPGYHPAHPIAPGGPPLGIWGGGNVPMPNPPIYIPITPPPESGLAPTHPIYIPVYPSQGPGFPTNPIVVPDPKAELVKAVKEAVEFWTGNLPPPPGGVTPVKK